MRAPLQRLLDLLDEQVVGHADVKRALLLGLLCREHVYLEGPPGTAKTLMAELVARGSELVFFFCQLHRDTRLADLLGDPVLERRPLPDGAGERVRQRIEPGGALTAEVCVLDDLSRAPGEALNVLLRVLNERRFGDAPLPLLSAIATGNPPGEAYYNEPLDPAVLDRFALQLRVEGLLANAAPEARELVDRFARPGGSDRPPVQAVTSRAELAALYTDLGRVRMPPAAVDALLRALELLRREHGCGADNALLTDRTFLVVAVKLLRGHALLADRSEVALEDLDVLRWMTAFRIPPEVHEKLPDVLDRARGQATG
jgi:MoxR-like ATPase